MQQKATVNWEHIRGNVDSRLTSGPHQAHQGAEGTSHTPAKYLIPTYEVIS